MRDVVVQNCHFEDYNWQNDRREETTMLDLQCIGMTDMREKVPEELNDPNWLENELDGTNELIRAIEAGQIKDVQPEPAGAQPSTSENRYGVEGKDAYSTAKLNEWHELAGTEEKRWWQW